MHLIKQLQSLDLNDQVATRRLLAGLSMELESLKRRGLSSEQLQLQHLLHQFCSTNQNKNPSWPRVRAALMEFSLAITKQLQAKPKPAAKAN